MKLRALGVIAAAVLAAACDDPLNVQPQQSLPQEEALDDAEELRVGANGMYDAMQADGAYNRNLLIFPDLYTDNLRFSGTFTTDNEVWTRNILASNGAIAGMWGAAYSAINRANNVLASIPIVEDFEDGEGEAFEGEARFVRALNYLNLVSFFGGVPLVLEPRWQLGPDVLVPRSSAAQVYAQIETDLTAAISLLPDHDEQTSGRASRQAAQALLARAHLYQREWAQARARAEEVLSSGMFVLEDNYADIFNNEQGPESIFELSYTSLDGNPLAFYFYPRALGGRRSVAPSVTRTAAPVTPVSIQSIFTADDERRPVAFTTAGTTAGNIYGNKYTDVAVGSDDVVVLRLAEMYLTRSEANARLGALPAAIADINVVRQRAGIGNLPATVDTQEEVLVANLEERRREFFYEGHRFHDLKRFMDVAPVGAYMATMGLTGNKLLFPIPQRELDANSQLTQNPGY